MFISQIKVKVLLTIDEVIIIIEVITMELAEIRNELRKYS